MKQLSAAGTIGKDAVTRTTQGGDKVTSWSVAVDDRQGQEKRTMWLDVSMWGKRGEALAQYLTKGTRVAVSGDLGTREHEGRTYLTVRADQVTLLGGGQEKRQERQEGHQEPLGHGGGGYDEDLPFGPCTLL